MKRLMVVVMAVTAIMGMLVVSAFAAGLPSGPANKLVVLDVNNNTLFTVQDGCGGILPCTSTQSLPFVGIGTAAPLFPLSITGSANTLLSLTTTSTTGGAGFQFSVPTGGMWYFKGTSDNGFKIRDAAYSKDVMYFQTSTGNVGIGTDSPAYPLQMVSGAYVSTGGVWTNASSRDYKDNIKELSVAEAEAAVKGLNPVTYTYKLDAGEQHVGFIAEDVPDLVATKDRKGLSSMDIVAVLTKVVQEKSQVVDRQQKTMEEQQRKIEEQRKWMEQLNEKVTMLERLVNTLTGRNMVSSLQ